MKIYQLKEDYKDPYTKISVPCTMTFLAPNDEIAKASCYIHPFRLDPYKILDEEGNIIHEHDPTKLSYEERSSPYTTPNFPTLVEIRDCLDSFSSVPVEYRRHFDAVLAKMDSVQEAEKYRIVVEKVYSPIADPMAKTWTSIEHPVRRRRMYSSYAIQGMLGISS